MSENATHLVVMGFMGVGKSTTARALASQLGGWEVRDSDLDLERIFGHTGAELADTFGVEELHRLEAAMLLGALGSETPSVISAAASTIEDERCREALGRRSTVVFLHLPLEETQKRAKAGLHRREMDLKEMAAAEQRRLPLFRAAWDVSLEATLTTGELVNEILSSPRFVQAG